MLVLSAARSLGSAYGEGLHALCDARSQPGRARLPFHCDLTHDRHHVVR